MTADITMRTSDFTYYMHDGPSAFSFELAGTISPDDAAELEQAWRTASSAIGDRMLVVDLSFVTQIDEAGRDLLRRWHEHGATLVANSPTARLLAESIIGAALPAAAAHAPTYLPFFRQVARRVAALLIVVLLISPHPLSGFC
jgi:ABC-type transporter Mla MlaB component